MCAGILWNLFIFETMVMGLRLDRILIFNEFLNSKVVELGNNLIGLVDYLKCA